MHPIIYGVKAVTFLEKINQSCLLHQIFRIVNCAKFNLTFNHILSNFLHQNSGIATFWQPSEDFVFVLFH